MKVCLAVASTYLPHVEKTPPLGVLYLASYLREQQGHETSLVDMKVHGLQTGEAARRILAQKPDVVGISSITLDSGVMAELAAAIKAASPETAIVCGGPHPTAYCDETIADPNVDYVVLGEGEQTLAELLARLDGGNEPDGIPGLVYRRGDDVVRSDSRIDLAAIDSLPLPAWDLIRMPDYWDAPRVAFIYAKREYMVITSSRGCPFGCAYCHKTLGRKWRPRAPEKVVDEIETLTREHGVREIVFVDDMTNLDGERLNSIARQIIERDLGLALSFPVGFRADLLQAETVRLLKRAGMYRCMVAVETASPRLQEKVHKNLDLAKVRSVIEMIAAEDILVHGVFMMGFPTETRDEMLRTAEFARRSSLHTMACARVIPFKDSELIQMAEEDGVRVKPDFGRFMYTDTESNLSRVPNDELRRIRQRMIRRFYLNPVRIYRFLRLLPNRFTFLGLLTRLFIKRAFFLP